MITSRTEYIILIIRQIGVAQALLIRQGRQGIGVVESAICYAYAYTFALEAQLMERKEVELVDLLVAPWFIYRFLAYRLPFTEG